MGVGVSNPLSECGLLGCYQPLICGAGQYEVGYQDRDYESLPTSPTFSTMSLLRCFDMNSWQFGEDEASFSIDALSWSTSCPGFTRKTASTLISIGVVPAPSDHSLLPS